MKKKYEKQTGAILPPFFLYFLDFFFLLIYKN